MRVALLITVCEPEREIAEDSLRSAINALQGADIELFIVDDASTSHLGDELAHTFSHIPSHVMRLPHSLAFKGTAFRFFLGLREIALRSRRGPAFDYLVKIDADTLFIRDGLVDFIRHVAPDRRGIFGCVFPMRIRFSFLVLADLIPFGFCRASVNGVISRHWRLARFGPVWWARAGWKAFLNGFRFQIIAGGFVVAGGETLTALAASRFLPDISVNDLPGPPRFRFGLICEDDTLMTLAFFAIGHGVTNLDTHAPGWGNVAVEPESDWPGILATSPYVVHPLKRSADSMAIRRSLPRPSMINGAT